MAVAAPPELGPSADLASEVRGLAAALQDGRLDRKGRQRCRYRLMRLSLEAGLAGQAAWRDLALDCALNSGLQAAGDWIATPQALELMPADSGAWACTCSVSEEAVDPAILHRLPDLVPEDVGPNVEGKYRVADITPTKGMLHIGLSPTTWQQGSSFHRAVMTHPERFLRFDGQHLVPVPLGPSRFPGLAVVHGIVVTSDRQILLSRRSDTVAYAPGHWSASYEEQVTTEDVTAGEGIFHRCAQRGLLEEFGVEVALSRIHFVSMLLQMDNLNWGAVMLIEIGETLDQLRERWLTEPRPTHAWEAHAIAGLAADADGLMRLSRGDAAGPGAFRPGASRPGASRPGAFHATSQLRLAVAARWLRNDA